MTLANEPGWFRQDGPAPNPPSDRLDITSVQTIQLASDQLHNTSEKVVAIVVTVAPDDRPAVLVMSRDLAEDLAFRLTHGEQAHRR